MKKKRITYGVAGMMEYQAVIHVGKAVLKVLFTDGSMTAMGVNPATFTTDNFMVQHAIEHSADFRRGRIHVMHVIELDEAVHIEREPAGAEVQPVAASSDGTAVAAVKGAAGGDKAEEAAPAADGAAEEAPAEVGTEVEFDTNDEAKDYLEQQFGVSRSKLRTRADIMACGEGYGVKISFS